MKFRIFIAVALLLTLLSTNMSCICSSGGGGSFTELMEWMPKDSSAFTYWNIETLGDGDGYHVWEGWEEEVTSFLDNIGGIKTHEVEQFSQALIDSEVVTIITGSFILDDVMQNLKNNDYTEFSSNNDVTLLTNNADDTKPAVALYKGKGIIVGTKDLVQSCIDIIQGKDGSHSLYEDSSIKAIADKLSGGLMTGIMKYTYNADTDSSLYKNLIGIGMSVEENDDTAFKVKVAHKFAVAGAAKGDDVLAKIQADLGEMDETAVKCKCSEPKASSNDDFVESSATITINSDNTNFSYFSLVEEEEE